ncbi:hypothetical protein [Nostoc flagelliforme]|uniref:hypothetical protein n=1 Tax=Nostoc flagelliforme TaxID=1306274 RepID=UPI00142E14F7|nr:hypothetical protein [Nostoc flagelliforme]
MRLVISSWQDCGVWTIADGPFSVSRRRSTITAVLNFLSNSYLAAIAANFC